MPKGYPLFDPSVEEVFGGAEVTLYALSTELAKDPGFKVIAITADYGQAESEFVEGVRVIKSLDFSKNALCGAVRIWRAMRKAEADIYFHEAASIGSFLVSLYCKLKRKVFIYRTASELECDGEYVRKHILAGTLFRRALKNASQVIVQNETDRSNIENSLGISAVVVRNAQRLCAPAGRQKDSILWVGRSDSIKKPGLFFELAKQFPGEKFVMICQRATSDREYDTLCREAKCISNLEFLERVPFRQVDSFFERAKIFVNTSDSEGFPNTFIQAGGCSTAMLSLRVDPDDFIKKYNCGVNCGGDFQKLVDSLRDILRDGSYVEMGENSRKYVEENHDIVKVVEQYKEIFIGLI